MAAALIAGVRAGIDQATWRDMQVSGLAHILSVSGLHMVLVAGSVFAACRWLLALIPPLALRYPVKKPQPPSPCWRPRSTSCSPAPACRRSARS